MKLIYDRVNLDKPKSLYAKNYGLKTYLLEAEISSCLQKLSLHMTIKKISCKNV